MNEQMNMIRHYNIAFDIHIIVDIIHHSDVFLDDFSAAFQLNVRAAEVVSPYDRRQ